MAKQTKKEDTMNTFYFVYNPSMDRATPYKRHADREIACDEAKRLSAKHPNTEIFVLKAEERFKSTCRVRSIKLKG